MGYIGALQSTGNFIRDGQDLNFENFCRVDLPFPPIEDQQQIALAVDRGTGQLASSIERASAQIGLLREYRARLIADVVAGKFDVREAATSLPALDLLAVNEGPDDESNRHAGLDPTLDTEGVGRLPDISHG